MAEERLYLPKGFTDQPQIREALEPYVKDGTWSDDITYFAGLPAGKAADILKILPKELVDDQQNDGPTFRVLVELGLEFGKVWFNGYVIGSKRDDERVSLEGFFCDLSLADAISARLKTQPNEKGEVDFADLGKVMRFWWD
jgi:hypothetical protein